MEEGAFTMFVRADVEEGAAVISWSSAEMKLGWKNVCMRVDGQEQ